MKTKILIPVISVAIIIIAIVIGMDLAGNIGKSNEFPNDPLFTLKRTGCDGPCPVYSVTIFYSGLVIFEGKEFVENVGSFQYKIPQENVRRIIDKINEIEFYNFDNVYSKEILSEKEPTVITTFRTQNYEKTVKNHGGAGPASLQELENLIDKMASTKPMITQSITQKVPPAKVATILDMQPNSMEFFYYPNPDETENRDAFQRFILIRLPEWMGGGANDASAFRAYSAVSLSDNCLVRYWPDPGRQRIENPCWGDIYRVIDGALILAVDPTRINSAMALPYLELSMDENGILFVEPPEWKPQKNGVVSIGREMSLQQIRNGSAILADSFANSFPNYPKIPVDFAGYILSDISPRKSDIDVQYFDFSSMSTGTSMTIRNTSAEDQQYFLNLATPDSEFWQIGKNVIRITTSGQDSFQPFRIEFFKEGFRLSIEGNNLEFLKREIVRNFFEEYSFDDMFLVSKN